MFDTPDLAGQAYDAYVATSGLDRSSTNETLHSWNVAPSPLGKRVASMTGGTSLTPLRNCRTPSPSSAPKSPTTPMSPLDVARFPRTTPRSTQEKMTFANATDTTSTAGQRTPPVGISVALSMVMPAGSDITTPEIPIMRDATKLVLARKEVTRMHRALVYRSNFTAIENNSPSQPHTLLDQRILARVVRDSPIGYPGE